jgi:hypothetical protein
MGGLRGMGHWPPVSPEAARTSRGALEILSQVTDRARSLFVRAGGVLSEEGPATTLFASKASRPLGPAAASNLALLRSGRLWVASRGHRSDRRFNHLRQISRCLRGFAYPFIPNEHSVKRKLLRK